MNQNTHIHQTQDCDLCGRPSSWLRAGACRECRDRLKRDDPNVPSPGAEVPGTEPPAYMKQLAERALGNLNWLTGLEQQVAEDLIGEALFIVSADIRAGRRVELEHLGALFPVTICGGTKMIRFKANERLTQPPALGNRNTGGYK